MEALAEISFLGGLIAGLAPVTATALGIGWLERSGRKAAFRAVSGSVIAALGAAMLAVPPEVIAALCRAPG